MVSPKKNKAQWRMEETFQIIHQFVSTNLHLANALFTSSSPDTGSTSGWKTGRSKTKRCVRKKKRIITILILMQTPLGWRSVKYCFQILKNCYCIKRKQPQVISTSCETVTQHTRVTCRVLSFLTCYHQIRKLIQLTAQAPVPTQVIISDKNRLKEFFWFSYLWLKAFYIPEL